jgi:hypothetical protein
MQVIIAIMPYKNKQLWQHHHPILEGDKEDEHQQQHCNAYSDHKIFSASASAPGESVDNSIRKTPIPITD